MKREILTSIVEAHRKIIMPSALEKTLRAGDAEITRLMDIYGKHSPASIKAANRDAAQAFVDTPTDVSSDNFFKSVASRLEHSTDIQRRSKEAARFYFVKKLAEPIAGIFERASQIIREEAAVEARAMRDRAKRWELQDRVRCPIEAILVGLANTINEEGSKMKAIASEKQIIFFAPTPSVVLKNVLSWEPLR